MAARSRVGFTTGPRPLVLVTPTRSVGSSEARTRSAAIRNALPCVGFAERSSTRKTTVRAPRLVGTRAGSLVVVSRRRCVGRWRGRRAKLEVIHGLDGPALPFQGHHEVSGRQTADRGAVTIDDDHVDRHEVDTRAEDRCLACCAAPTATTVRRHTHKTMTRSIASRIVASGRPARCAVVGSAARVVSRGCDRGRRMIMAPGMDRLEQQIRFLVEADKLKAVAAADEAVGRLAASRIPRSTPGT